MPHRDPLAIFFKLPPDASPVALLGLRPGQVSDEDIIAARTRRLEVVDRHALSGTPDADEARLAVHTAAALLLRQAATHRSQPISPRPTNQATQGRLPTPQPRMGVAQAAAALDKETLILVGLAGGWAPRVLMRLAAVAITRGLGPNDAIAAVLRLAKNPGGASVASPSAPPIPPRGARPPAPPAGPRVADTPLPGAVTDEVTSDEAVLEDWIKASLVIVGTILLTLAILVVGAVWALGTLRSPQPAAPEPHPSAADATTAPPSDRIAPPRDDVRNADLVLYELNAGESLAQSRRSPRAVARVNAALEHWLEQWPTHPNGSWRQVVGRLIPLLESIRQDPAGDAALADMFAGFAPSTDQPLTAAAVPRQIALAAILGSLAPSESSKVTRVLADAWHARSPYAPPPGALPAAKASLLALAQSQLADTPEAYEAWSEAAGAIARTLVENPEPILLAGASDLLGRIEPPTAGERDAIAAMIARLDWRSGSTARAWLLARLNDRTVHPERVAAAINALATGTSAPGIPTSLHLDPKATWDARYEMSQTLAESWGLRVSANSDLFTRDWLTRADELLGAAVPDSDLKKLEHLGNLSYLNTSASLSRAGRDEPAITNLSRSHAGRSPLEPLSPLFRNATGAPLTLAVAEGDNDSILFQLDTISSVGVTLSHADAATLMELIFRSRNENVRTAAVDALRPVAVTPEVILGALETSPLISDTAANRSLLSLVAGESVAPSPGELWGDALHRVLAQALLSRTPSPTALVDDTARRVMQAYSSAAFYTPVPREATLGEHVRSMTNAQLFLVNPDPGSHPITTPARIASLRDTRLRVAQSPIQRFAIELHALAAATALAAASNDPALQRPAQTLWDQLQRDRSRAGSAIDQAVATETMLARLNAILLSTKAPVTARADARVRRETTDAESASSPASVTAPAGPLSGASRGDLAARLEQLSPDTPAAYVDLADELLAAGRENLAIHTLVVAVFLASDRGDPQTVASACLALATLTPDTDQEQMLRALAETVNPRLNRPRWLDQSGVPGGRSEAGLNAARLLLDLRRGRGEEALAALREEATTDILSVQPELKAMAAARGATTLAMLADLARAWPCPECNNDRAYRPRGETHHILCTHCQGHPGPVLSDSEQIAWLTTEVRLLSPEEPWSSALLFPGHNEPVSEPALGVIPRMFREDPSLSLYRNGRWVHP